MGCVLAIASGNSPAKVLGTRFSAIDLRERIEEQLENCHAVQVDFGGTFVTQSFVDELLGPLVLRMGPAILDRLAFSGCVDATRAILQLVLAARLQDFAERQKGLRLSQAHLVCKS